MAQTSALWRPIAVMMLNNRGIDNSFVKTAGKTNLGLMLPIIKTLTTAQYKTAKNEKYIMLAMQFKKNGNFFLGTNFMFNENM